MHPYVVLFIFRLFLQRLCTSATNNNTSKKPEAESQPEKTEDAAADFEKQLKAEAEKMDAMKKKFEEDLKAMNVRIILF